MEARQFARAAVACGLLLTLIGAAGCKEQGTGGVKVEGFKFNGIKAVKRKQLQSVLATAGSSKLPWGEKRYFSRKEFEADLKRIEAFYHDRGYPDARVASFDAKLSPDQTSVDITITISEGEPVVAERIEFEGFDPLPETHRTNLEQSLPLKQGAPMDRALIQASREAALDELRDHGYPYASVRVAEAPGSGERRRVLELIADAGPLAHHGPVEITGNSSVSDGVIQRQLTFKPGDLFSQSKLLESQRKLYTLEVFQFANVQAVRDEGQKSAEIPMRVTVTEGKHRKVNFSFGYGTEEKGRVEIDWRHVNFFGGARTAGVRARYSALDRGVKLNLKQPYLFSPRYSFDVQGQYWHNDEPAFVLDNVGGRATVTREFGVAGRAALGSRPATTLSLTYANEWEDYVVSEETLADPTTWDELIALGLDPRTGKGRGQRISLSVDAARNTTNNVLDAHRGYLAAVHLESGGKFLGGKYDYVEVTGEGRYYISIGERTVFAVRARGGAIDGPGELIEEFSVPFYKRYFLGGSTNLRGWGRFDVSPLSLGGQPVGGHSFVNFSTEVRVPIWRNLSGVAFLDGGNVWRRPWDINLNDLYYDAGPGLRYNTPIGPIRVDVGFQLNEIPGLVVNGEPEPRHFRIHFSIGQAF